MILHGSEVGGAQQAPEVASHGIGSRQPARLSGALTVRTLRYRARLYSRGNLWSQNGERLAEQNEVLQHNRNMRSKAIDICTVLVLALALALATMPGSIVRTAWDVWRRDRATSRAATQNWLELTTLGSAFKPVESDSVAIIEVLDYECPFCRAVHFAVDSLVSLSKNVVYVHYPIKSHRLFGISCG